jgi:antitoxin (DNA-binding transcriptional repressor) of toxin-antitoxin stability system
VPAHRVVDQHPLERLDIFLERLALGRDGRPVASLSAIRSDRSSPSRAVLQHRAFGDVDQLADIAGPGRLQKLRGLLGRHLLRRVAAVFLGELVGKHAGEQRQDILAALRAAAGR